MEMLPNWHTLKSQVMVALGCISKCGTRAHFKGAPFALLCLVLVPPHGPHTNAPTQPWEGWTFWEQLARSNLTDPHMSTVTPPPLLLRKGLTVWHAAWWRQKSPAPSREEKNNGRLHYGSKWGNNEACCITE